MFNTINGAFPGDYVARQTAAQRANPPGKAPEELLAAYLVCLVVDLSDKRGGGRANARRVAARLRLDITLLNEVLARLEQEVGHP